MVVVGTSIIYHRQDYPADVGCYTQDEGRHVKDEGCSGILCCRGAVSASHSIPRLRREYNGHNAKNQVAAYQVQDRPGKVVLVRWLRKDHHGGLSRYDDSRLRLATIVCCFNSAINGNQIGGIDPLARWNGRVAL